MSTAQRKAVGERMKRYWAARHDGAQATTATANSDSPAKVTRPGRRAAKRGARTMSPEARKRISDAQKARWAKQRGEAKAAETSSAGAAVTVKDRRTAKRIRQRAAKRGSRKMSAAARKRISQAQKKRWAAKRKTA